MPVYILVSESEALIAACTQAAAVHNVAAVARTKRPFLCVKLQQAAGKQA